MSWVRLGLSSLLIFFCACSSIKHPSTAVPLSKGVVYTLQPVPVNMQGKVFLQKLTVTASDNKHQLIVQTELHTKYISMVGFSQSGLQLFELRWQLDEPLEVKKNITLPDIKVEQLLAYYQLSNWPINRVRNGLRGMQLRLENSNLDKRHFFVKQQLVFDVTTGDKRSTLIHYKDQYTIEIENLE